MKKIFKNIFWRWNT